MRVMSLSSLDTSPVSAILISALLDRTRSTHSTRQVALPLPLHVSVPIPVPIPFAFNLALFDTLGAAQIDNGDDARAVENLAVVLLLVAGGSASS